MELNLQRPLLFFDIESTGLNIPTDGIIELSFVKVMPGGEVKIKTWKIKPWDYVNHCTIPINPQASELKPARSLSCSQEATSGSTSMNLGQSTRSSSFTPFTSDAFGLMGMTRRFR